MIFWPQNWAFEWHVTLLMILYEEVVEMLLNHPVKQFDCGSYDAGWLWAIQSSPIQSSRDRLLEEGGARTFNI